MEAESGKYLEERFPFADKRASGVIRTSASASARCIVHVIVRMRAQNVALCARAESSAVLGYLLCSKGLLLLPPS